MIRGPPRSTLSSSSAASDVYKRQEIQRALFSAVKAAQSIPELPDHREWDQLSDIGKDRHKELHNALIVAVIDLIAVSQGESVENAVGELSLIHISEPTRRTPISYAVFCLKKKHEVIMHRKMNKINWPTG